MSRELIHSEIRSRFERIRTGVDVGFADPAESAALRELRGGTWMTVVDRAAASVRSALPAGTTIVVDSLAALPFEEDQFEVAVMNGAVITEALVKEIHRILKPAGYFFFAVRRRSRGDGEGYEISDIYNRFLRSGFDVVSVKRPSWFSFGSARGMFTVTARKKAWKEHRRLAHDGSLPFEFRNR